MFPSPQDTQVAQVAQVLRQGVDMEERPSLLLMLRSMRVIFERELRKLC